MGVTYPGSVTFWKFTCPACSKPYTIEIIDHRKCLVYEQQGQRLVERIGLTEQRQSFYRARCQGCGTILIANEEQLEKRQSCHHCRLPFRLRLLHDEVYYETEVNWQGQSALFRDRVQTLAGNIFNAGNLYFLDEDRLTPGAREWAELLSRLESELELLRTQGKEIPQVVGAESAVAQGDEQSLRAFAEERELLNQQWQQKLQVQVEEKEALHREWQQKWRLQEEQGERVREHAQQMQEQSKHLQEQAVRLQERLQQLEKQNEQLLEERNAAAQRLAHYDEVIRYLDQQTTLAVRLENRVAQLTATVEQLNQEKRGLLGQLAGQSERILLLEQERAKQSAQWQAERQQQEEQLRLQQENHLLSEKIGGLHEILQNLQQQSERANRFETLYVDTALKLKKLKGENLQLTHRLSEREESVNRLERQVEQAGRMVAGGDVLEARLQELQQENQRLQGKAREQSRLEARVAQLEAELSLLRRRGEESEEGMVAEEWYGEEGEEWSLPAHAPGAAERRILGLKGEPTPERIKAALRKRIRQYHPDRVASLGQELREVAHRKTQEITRAYAQLMAIYGRR